MRNFSASRARRRAIDRSLSISRSFRDRFLAHDTAAANFAFFFSLSELYLSSATAICLSRLPSEKHRPSFADLSRLHNDSALYDECIKFHRKIMGMIFMLCRS